MLWFLRQELILDPLRVYASQQITQVLVFGFAYFLKRMGEINV